MGFIMTVAPQESSATDDVTEAEDAEKIFDTFTLYWENDTFAGTDRDYSNGIKLTWSTPYGIADNGNDHLPDWSYPLINNLPFVNDPSSHRAVSVSVGQMHFTPAATDRTDLVIDDRPYAGFLYLASGFHNQIGNRKSSWEIQLGVVGPLAFGEETQDAVHDLLDADKAGGWDHQLKNEIGVEIISESKWQLSPPETRWGLNYDLIPHMGFRVGNIQAYVNAGAEIRYGWNLPRDFGSCLIRAGCSSNSAFNGTPALVPGRVLTGWHIFAAVDGRVVAHDIFLDGNTFRDSHSVDREVLVGDLMAGMAMDFGRIRTTYSYVIRSKQFETEDKNHLFGSLTFSWAY
ncbi:MAG: lipid A deacylase LpxR family protein [Desulfobulbaceae bacterium]|nr:lipid A deacylase LpxR family protein [Desulfobulbaceae bacterium]